MQIFNGNIPSNIKINTNAEVNEKSASPNVAINNGVSFQDVLGSKIAESTPLTFSKHANLRLNSRNIRLSAEQLNRVEDGLTKARQKGINDSLVMVDDIRLVVNVKSKTVITAMNKENENIFTNIDGAIIV